MRNLTAALAVAGISFCLACSQHGLAADLALKAPAVPPTPSYNWTGFFFGPQLGYGWGTENRTQTTSNAVGNTCPAFNPNGCDIVSPDLSGVLGGFQVGGNYQMGVWVLGIGADFDWTGMNGCGQFVFSPPGWDGCTKALWLFSQTARIGYAGWDHGRLLAYLKGGVAEVDTDRFATMPGAIQVTETQNESRVGWTIGGGFEWALINAWSAFVEYDYADFGTKNYLGVGTGPLAGLLENFDVKEHYQQVKVGVSYHFASHLQ